MLWSWELLFQGRVCENGPISIKGSDGSECECEATLIGWREEILPPPSGYDSEEG